MEKRKMKKRNVIIILLLALITVGAVMTTVIVLLNRDNTPVLAPEYAPQDTDDNAKPIENDDNTKLEAAEGGGAVSLTYSKEVTITLSDKKANVVFQNPGKSTKDIVLQLIIESDGKEVVMAQSDLLPAGYMLNTMTLLDTAKLSAGGYNGKFNVLYYDPDSGERAIVNTNIPLTITVK